MQEPVLFDRTIAAWKVRGEIYEKCRTSHGKTVSDLIKCSQLKKGDKICFLDDQKHSRMIHRNVDYLYLYPYKFDYLFKKMTKIFLKSNSLIKKDDYTKFEEHVIYFSKNNPIGYRYIERKNTTNYDKQEISIYLKDFFKNNKKYTLTKKNKRKNKTRRKK